MTHETKTHTFSTGDRELVFHALTRDEWRKIEQDKKTKAVKAWMGVCEDLRLPPMARRVQITEILTTPMAPTLRDLDGIMRASMAKGEHDATREDLEAIAKHGNTEEGGEDFAALITFLFERAEDVE